MTRNFTKIGLSVLMVVLMVLPVMVGCAKPSVVPPGEEIVIKVGHIEDFTGPVACCGVPADHGIADYFQYMADENAIPGVSFELISYDNNLDPGKTAPGYQFCKANGMHVIFTAYGQDSAIVKPLAGADHIPNLSYNTNMPVIDPPGWTFCQMPLAEDYSSTGAAWIIDNWDYKKMGRNPNVAQIAYPTGTGGASMHGFETFCNRNSDKLNFVSGITLPMGSVDMAEPCSEFNRLKVDYVFQNVPPGGTLAFLKEVKAKGYTYITILPNWVQACPQTLLKVAGPLLVGTYWLLGWNFMNPFTAELADRYHTAKELAEQDYKRAMCYDGLGVSLAIILEAAVKGAIKAGDDPRDGDALYEQLKKIKNLDMKGISPPMTFGENRRMGISKLQMYEGMAPDGIPKRVGDWQPVASFDGNTAKFYK